MSSKHHCSICNRRFENITMHRIEEHLVPVMRSGMSHEQLRKSVWRLAKVGSQDRDKVLKKFTTFLSKLSNQEVGVLVDYLLEKFEQ